MRITRRGALASALAALATMQAGSAGAQADTGRDDPEAISISGRPLPVFQPSDPGRRRFGALVYRGGLQLSSGADGFGGFSGLWRAPDGGRIVAVTDRGSWLTARVDREGNTLKGLSEAILAPILNASGRPIGKTRSYDTEALCIDNSVAYVGVERTHEILRFDWARRGTAARGIPVPTPPEIRRLPRNRGLEAIGVAPLASPVAGAIICIAERSGSEDEPTAGWIIGGRTPGLFRYLRRDRYDVTDLAFLPDGDMLVLERWYRAWRGVGMRVRRVPGPSIQPGAMLDGPVLIEADLGQEIDNMEGLAVHREAGKTILTMISDDNFSMIQRTILLEFELAD